MKFDPSMPRAISALVPVHARRTQHGGEIEGRAVEVAERHERMLPQRLGADFLIGGVDRRPLYGAASATAKPPS